MFYDVYLASSKQLLISEISEFYKVYGSVVDQVCFLVGRFMCLLFLFVFTFICFTGCQPVGPQDIGDIHQAFSYEVVSDIDLYMLNNLVRLCY